MLNSTVLEVAIGLSFAYAAVALISSSIYEAIASVFKLRARSLLSGVKEMLNDQGFEKLAKGIYSHALVNPRDSGTGNTLKHLPSYIDSKNFSVALIDQLQSLPGEFKSFQETINAIPDRQLKQLLTSLWSRADGSLELLTSNLSDWFDDGMARVSGAYKREAQVFSFLIAFTVAGLLNIDSFHLFAVLWKHAALVPKLSGPAHDAAQALQDLSALPIGWSDATAFSGTMVLGWLMTASSALFGAPFWFDALQRLTNVRGTGPKPNKDRLVVAAAPAVRALLRSAAE